MGIGMTLTRYVAELKGANPERTGRIIGLCFWVSWIAGTAMALICFFGAPYLATIILNSPKLVNELKLLSLLLLISIIFGRQHGILTGLKAFREISILNVVGAIIGLPIITFSVWQAGLWGGIWGFIITQLITGSISTYFLIRECRKAGITTEFRSAWREKSVLWSFSLPAYLAEMLYSPATWVVNAILVNQSNGYAEMGLFNAANQFHRIIMALISMMATVSVPLLAELSGNPNLEMFNKAFNLNLRLTTNLAAAVGFMALGFSQWLIQIFGEQFYAAGNLLPIIIAFTVSCAAGSICGQLFYSSGNMWYSLATNVFWGFSLIITGYFIIPLFLGKGLAIAYSISYVINLLLQLIIIKKLFGKTAISNIYPSIFYIILLTLVCFFYDIINNKYYLNIFSITISIIIFYQVITENIIYFKQLVLRFSIRKA
jgi:O-antigen/teichoic acid export membrane protein